MCPDTPKRQGGDLFIVDNSDSDWKALPIPDIPPE